MSLIIRLNAEESQPLIKENVILKDWPQGERPREKLLSNGAAQLSDAELLAIFLRTGISGCNVIELARKLLTAFGDISGVYRASLNEFCQIQGLGKAKYVQLQASIEMTKRYLAQELTKGSALTSSAMTKEYLMAELKPETREVFAVLILDNQHQIIRFEKLFFGTINAAAVYPRIVVEFILKHQGNAVILAHNHPSGVSEPSQSDKLITRKLVDALALIDVVVLDHLIVAGHQCFSFAEHGLL